MRKLENFQYNYFSEQDNEISQHKLQLKLLTLTEMKNNVLKLYSPNFLHKKNGDS